MKKFTFLLLFSASIATGAWSQALNFAQTPSPSGNVISLNLGFDHAFQATVGFAHQFKTVRPLVVGTEFSLPSGNTLLDDWRWKTGAQYNFLQSGNFRLTGKAQLVFRKRKTDYVNHFGWGTDLGLIGGWYREKFFLAAETGYDRTWFSHIRHDQPYLEQFPEAVSGWYQSKAANVYVGIQGGYSWQRLDINLRLGRTFRPNGSANLVPLYAMLGANIRI